jgi:hypothetical protein
VVMRHAAVIVGMTLAATLAVVLVALLMVR